MPSKLRALWAETSRKVWYDELSSTLFSLGFRQCRSKETLFTTSDENGLLILLIYVDIIVIMGEKLGAVNKFKEKFAQYFEFRDLGAIKNYLGVTVRRDQKGLHISQKHSINEVLKKFGMDESKPSFTPLPSDLYNRIEAAKPCEIGKYPVREAIGSLIYLMNGTRPDISFAVSFLARFADKPSDELWIQIKRILRYLQGS